MDATSKRTLDEKLDLTREAVETRASSVRILRELAEMPGWELLKATFGERRRKYESSLATALMAGNELDQRQLDYNRGFFAGLQQLMAAPEKAETLLEQALVKLKRLESINPEGE